MENRTAVNGILILVRTLKERKKKELETQTSVDIKEEEEEAIKELENQGDLKKDVPVGGEEFENEEPRQGE
jgi:hypothetical protein